jgi:hypothetical protein
MEHQLVVLFVLRQQPCLSRSRIEQYRQTASRCFKPTSKNKRQTTYGVRDLYGGEDVNGVDILSRDTVHSGTWVPRFRRNVLPPYIGY